MWDIYRNFSLFHNFDKDENNQPLGYAIKVAVNTNSNYIYLVEKPRLVRIYKICNIIIIIFYIKIKILAQTKIKTILKLKS